MERGDAQQRITLLRSEILRHDRQYYVEGCPLITDQQYDGLYKELADLESQFPDLITPDSPTQKVGNGILPGFKTVKHVIPMLSLDHTYDKADLRRFCDATSRAFNNAPVLYTIEPKIDGVSISIRYENGWLAQALTRGNGVEGDDVTANVRTIVNMPLKLGLLSPPRVFEVRGEVCMLKHDLRALNEARVAAKEPPFVNTRSATIGSLKLRDARLVARRPLLVLLYGCGEVDGLDISSQLDLFDCFQYFDLPINRPTLQANSVDEVIARVEEMESKYRAHLPYEIDGVVVKVNSFAKQQWLGCNARAPLWAKAFKYASGTQETVLRRIVVQVSPTGAFTPVAEFDPVTINGTTMTRATLHNVDEIALNDIRVGDTILVKKAGEVIPDIAGVVLDKRPADAVPYDMAASLNGHCPSCGEPVRDADTLHVRNWRCCNPSCPEQLVGRLLRFASKPALSISNLERATAEALVRQKLMHDPLDLFGLDCHTLANLNINADEGTPRLLGEKRAADMFSSIQVARTLPLHRWLFALGIPNVGVTVAKVIATHHSNLGAVVNSTLLQTIAKGQRITDVKIGIGMAQCILDHFATDIGKKQLEILRKLQINPVQ